MNARNDDATPPPAGTVRPPPAAAALEHLSGRERGTVSWLTNTTGQINVQGGASVRLSEPGDAEGADPYVRLHRSAETFELEVLEGRQVWVNGERADSHELAPGDLIELGEGGPLLRFRSYRSGTRMPKSMAAILSDCVDSARARRKAPLSAAFHFLADLVRDLSTQTTLLFRFTMISAVIGLSAYAFYLDRFNEELRLRLAEESSRLTNFAESLLRSQSAAVHSSDIADLREEFTSTRQRVEALEERTDASARVIEKASPSIAFLQGSYGFHHTKSGRMLRYVTNSSGQRLASPHGQPLLSLDGNGPVAERQFIGTAFAIGDGAELVTNRHVAVPWETDSSLESMTEQGLAPVLVRLIGYLPGVDEPFDVSVRKASESADIALLSCECGGNGFSGIELSARPPSPGEEVIVMGYPTGLRSMLAQTGEEFLSALDSAEALDFWDIARRLSVNRFIRPLASRGIVGQVSDSAIVYDAETTHGGSGGPVINIDGQVVAVNAAIVPEYGGSNFGVPVRFVHDLLDESRPIGH